MVASVPLKERARSLLEACLGLNWRHGNALLVVSSSRHTNSWFSPLPELNLNKWYVSYSIKACEDGLASVPERCPGSHNYLWIYLETKSRVSVVFHPGQWFKRVHWVCRVAVSIWCMISMMKLLSFLPPTFISRVTVLASFYRVFSCLVCLVLSLSLFRGCFDCLG